jgi:hypothetical protein
MLLQITDLYRYEFVIPYWRDVFNSGTPVAPVDTDMLKIFKNKKLLQFALEER